MNRTRWIFFSIISVTIIVVSAIWLRDYLKVRDPVVVDQPNSTPRTVPEPPVSKEPVQVTIVSSSTKRDWLNQVIGQFNGERHTTSAGRAIKVEVSHTTSGGSMIKILEGDSQPVAWSPGDASWVDQINNKWRLKENRSIIRKDCSPTVYAPIGFAMWRPMAEALGWPDNPIGWDTIVKLASDPNGWASYGHPEWGQFTFGHTHPDYSNTGLLAMTSFVYGIAGTTSLTAADVYQAKIEEAMRSLEKNTAKYGRSSSALFDLMVDQGTSYVHAIAASEETTIRYNINHRGRLRFPLAFIFPSGGAIWADHPFCILDNADWVSDDQVEAAGIFRKYILESSQQALSINHRLRPTDTSIPLSAPFNLENGSDPSVNPSNSIRLPSPDQDVSAAVKDLFKTTKRKATVIIAMDVSGSMRGAKIRTATSATVEFLKRLAPEDEVSLLTFSDNVVTLSQPGLVRDVVETLSQKVSTLIADGSTALYGTVCKAAILAGQLQTKDAAQGEFRLYGIVLLSDGEDTVGKPSAPRMFATCLPANAEAKGFKIFPIAFGKDADTDVLARIARVTGGRMFSADPDSIGDVYFSISAEQ